MLFSATHFPSSRHATPSIAHRIATVAQGFLSHLAAILRHQSDRADAERIERARAKDAAMLYRMAKQYEALSPNLSAELRFLASRG